jgi:serine/threonine protein kinase
MTKNKGASSEVIVKLSDFGFSRYFDVTEAVLTTGYDDLVSTICGSPIYMAPELLVKMKYNVKADIWSFGVIMYEMLHGRNPYYSASSIPELRELMMKQQIMFNNFSPECLDLLQKILQPDPIKRISWEEFFNHDWFTSTIIGIERKINCIGQEEDQEEKEEQEEQQIFELDEDLEKKRVRQNVTRSVPTLKSAPMPIPKKKSEDDFIIIQREEDGFLVNTNGEQQIKMYNETYTSSIIKILTNSIVYVFGGNKQQSQSL